MLGLVSLPLPESVKKTRLYTVLSQGFFVIFRGLVALFKKKKGAVHHIGSTVSYMSGTTFVLGKPINITIEPTNTCNLACPSCETGVRDLGRANGHMSVEDFKKIIDKIKGHTNYLMFYFMGEPFLRKTSYEMIRYAKDSGIPYVVSSTNGDMVNPELLVNSGIDEIHFQIGGITQEAHSTYRVNSKIDRVLENLKETIRIRNEKKAKMKINCGFIIMKHNEHQLNDWKILMKQIGVDEMNEVDACVRDAEQGKKFLSANRDRWFYDPDRLEKDGILAIRREHRNECAWIHYTMTITVNGDIVPCCRDPRGTEVVGNILRQDLGEIWNGEKYRNFRRRILTDQKNIEICRLCETYAAPDIR